MSSQKHVHDLMTRIGPQLQLAEVTEFEDERLWTLVVDEETVLFAEYDPDTNRIVLSAIAGSPPRERRDALYGTLLEYNNQWEETGGVRMALNGPDGEVIQIFDVNATDLDLSEFQTVVSNFADTLQAWREIVRSEQPLGGEANGIPIEENLALTPGMMRA